MKIALRICVLVFILVLLEGCWDRTELNDLAIVTAMSFDKAEDNQIITTVQIIVPQNQGGGGMSGAATSGAPHKTTIRSGVGINISDSLSKLQRIIPRKMFWGQCKIFIFSEDVAKAGIKDEFDFLMRHPQPRERAFVFVSKEKAAKTLEMFPPIERSSSEVLRKLTELKIGINVTLEQFSIMLKGDAEAAALPLVYILPKAEYAEPFQTIPYIMGTALFKKDKMVGQISEKTTRGVMWIINKIDDYTVTFEMNGKDDFVSIKPVNAKVKLLPKIRGDKWMMEIQVRATGDIIQNGTDLNPMNPKLLKKMESAFEKDINTRIKLAIQEVQKQKKTDILGFANAFHRKYPKQWEKNKDRWDVLYPQVKVTIDVTASILRPGLINSPGGIPIGEVQQK
ncbi:Ger(x)C family spore germination protein [Paenibacillus wynnii]|uniref:Ger(x)C family spore germination protein n=1 Tax=Paenibacillus wynnii TaxID=268407 RepID=UPI0027912D7B|nr:Ger(x)C family spore germination protein [Paenibacillus wynnii]MDQ0194279.1 spore germination protein KC [Paenibacillus wynnii]